jgi:hypothetical protein
MVRLRTLCKKVKVIEPAIVFIVLILSWGLSLGLLLKFRVSIEYFELLIPLLFAAISSAYRFYRNMTSIENGKCPK